MLRARDMNVGDRRQADFVTLLGLVELFQQRLLVELREVQLVFRGEHAEIRRGRAHDQILRGGVVVAVGACGRLVRLTQALDVAPVEDRLRRRQLPPGANACCWFRRTEAVRTCRRSWRRSSPVADSGCVKNCRRADTRATRRSAAATARARSGRPDRPRCASIRQSPASGRTSAPDHKSASGLPRRRDSSRRLASPSPVRQIGYFYTFAFSLKS